MRCKSFTNKNFDSLKNSLDRFNVILKEINKEIVKSDYGNTIYQDDEGVEHIFYFCVIIYK